MRKLELNEENKKSTNLRIRGLLWAFQNGIAHVCSYSQSLDQFGFTLVFRKLNSIHIFLIDISQFSIQIIISFSSVNVEFPVFMLHQTDSASFYFSSYPWIDSLIYRIFPTPLLHIVLHILSFPIRHLIYRR